MAAKGAQSPVSAEISPAVTLAAAASLALVDPGLLVSVDVRSSGAISPLDTWLIQAALAAGLTYHRRPDRTAMSPSPGAFPASP